MVSESTFDVMALLVSVSVFAAGFLSVRLHAQRDRAIDRAERIHDYLNNAARRQQTVGEAELRRLDEAVVAGMTVDPVARLTLWFGGGLFGALVLIAIHAGASADWVWTLNPWEVVHEFWLAAAAVAAGAATVALAVVDVWWVRKDLKRRHNASPLGRNGVGHALVLDAEVKLEAEETEVAHRLLRSAVADFEAVIKQVPTWSWAWNNLGYAHYKLGDFAPAQRYYEKALKLEPGYPRALVNRGNISYSLEDFRRAIEDYTDAIEQDAEYAVAYKWRCLSFLYLGERLSAEHDFETLQRLDPEEAKELEEALDSPDTSDEAS